MSTWTYKNLGDASLASEQQDRIRELLHSALAGAEKPEHMAAFLRHESEGRLHCEVKIYFSPMSATVARQVDAKPCQRPSPDGLGLLAGSPEAWRVLFPERSR